MYTGIFNNFNKRSKPVIDLQQLNQELERVRKVVDSCQTPLQLLTAKRWAMDWRSRKRAQYPQVDLSQLLDGIL